MTNFNAACVRSTLLTLSLSLVPLTAQAINVESATITPGPVPAGSEITLTVKVKAGFGTETWSATRLSLLGGQFGNGICLENEQPIELITHEEAEVVYTLAAPNTPGTYSTLASVYSGPGCLNGGSSERAGSIEVVAPEVPPVARTTVRVYKWYADGNPNDATIRLDCNTGFIPDQVQNVSNGQSVVFIVTEHTVGELKCQVTETGSVGYITSYVDTSGGIRSDVECAFTDLYFSHFECQVFNELYRVPVEVTKEWVDEYPEFNNSTYARAEAACVNEYSLYDEELVFDGDGAKDAFEVGPSWAGDTVCWVTEQIRDGSVISDASDCQDIKVVLGDDELECTIVNTRIYEGIPALSQYGLAVLALIVAGMGLVGFRRFG